MFCLEAQAPESSQKFSEGLSIGFVHAVYKPGLVELATVEVAVSPILGLYCTRWPACDAHFAVYMKHWLPITEGELLKAPKELSGCVLFWVPETGMVVDDKYDKEDIGNWLLNATEAEFPLLEERGVDASAALLLARHEE